MLHCDLLYSCGKWRIILVFTKKVVSLHAESKTSAMTDIIRKVLRNVIGGGKSCCSALLLLLALSGFAACTEDSPASPEPQNLVETRTTADSTAVGDTSAVPSGELQADTAWAGEDIYDYDGNLLIPVTEGEVTTGDAADAV